MWTLAGDRVMGFLNSEMCVMRPKYVFLFLHIIRVVR